MVQNAVGTLSEILVQYLHGFLLHFGQRNASLPVSGRESQTFRKEWICSKYTGFLLWAEKRNFAVPGRECKSIENEQF